MKEEAPRYRRCAIALGALGGFQVLTGTALSILSAGMSASAACERIVLYLTLVACLEAALFFRMRKSSVVFPTRAVVSPIAASLLFFAAALGCGF